MKQRSKVIATSIATIAMCASLAVGGTYALFTSESEVNIAVTAGNVELTATIDEKSIQTYSGQANGGTTKTEADYDIVKQEMPTYFSNGGFVELNGGKLSINNISPMDSVEFNIVLKNESTIQINYQTIIESADEGLLGGLEMEIGGVAYTSESGRVVSEAEILVAADKEVTIPVSIALPYEAGEEYEGTACELTFTVAAVQGNANALYEPTAKDDEEESTHLVVKTASDLVKFMNNAGKYQTVELANDINLGGMVWKPVGGTSSWDSGWAGTFDGKNYTISDFKISTSTTAAGFFSALKGTVKDLTFDGVSVYNTNEAVEPTGVVAGTMTYVETLVSNVHVKNSAVNAVRWAGGIAGYLNNATITGCSVSDTTFVATPNFDGTKYDNGDKVGGIAGYSDSTANTLTNNKVERVSITAYRDFGGIIGGLRKADTFTGNTVDGLTLTYLTVDGVYDDGATPNGNAGAIVGRDLDGITLDASNTATNVTLNVAVADAETLTKVLNSNVDTLNITLADGNYMNKFTASNKTINVTGDNGAVIGITKDLTAGALTHEHLALHGCTVTFNGVKILFEDGGYYSAFTHYTEITYNNCTITGQFYTYGKTNFIGCTFDNDDEAATTAMRYTYVYGGDVLVDGCTFLTRGHALIMFSDTDSNSRTLTVRNSTFKALENGRNASGITNQWTAGIEIDSTYTSYTLKLEGTNTVEGDYFSGLWRIKTMNNNVTVNDTTYTKDMGDTFVEGEAYTKTSIGNNQYTVAKKENA